MSTLDVLAGKRRWWVGHADTLDFLRTLPDGCIHTCVTSPPYYALRDYNTAKWEGGEPHCDHRPKRLKPGRNEDRQTFGDIYATHPTQLIAFDKKGECDKCGAVKVDRQLGLESSPDCLGWATNNRCGACYVCKMTAVFAEVRRVLRDDGCCWLNIGDSYNAYNGNRGEGRSTLQGRKNCGNPELPSGYGLSCKTLKPKDLLLIPARLALSLQAEGWYVRCDCVWEANRMPGSQQDRPTRNHEQIWLLTKSERYWYDWYAEATPAADGSLANLRSVWKVALEPHREKHYASYPTKLVRRMLRLSTSEKGCCPACGAQWRRILKKTRKPTRPGVDVKYTEKADGDTLTAESMGWNQANTIGNRDPQRHCTVTEMLGWEPTCKCGRDDLLAPVCLDPFMGSGTTAIVARRLGLRVLGCDLNQDYVAMARRRVGEDMPLFNAANDEGSEA